MAQDATPQIYVCRNCGRMALAAGHLCSPRPFNQVTHCSYCGVVVEDPRHLCAPKVVQLRYICRNCGRVAVSNEFLCSPVAIPHARSEIMPPKSASIAPLLRARVAQAACQSIEARRRETGEEEQAGRQEEGDEESSPQEARSQEEAGSEEEAGCEESNCPEPQEAPGPQAGGEEEIAKVSFASSAWPVDRVGFA